MMSVSDHGLIKRRVGCEPRRPGSNPLFGRTSSHSKGKALALPFGPKRSPKI